MEIVDKIIYNIPLTNIVENYVKNIIVNFNNSGKKTII